MHFLKESEARAWRQLGQPRAAVRVRVEGGRKGQALVIDPEPEEPIMVLKADAQVALLPTRVPVLDPTGRRVKASGIFVVTVETFDPFHAVCDMPKDWW